MHDRLSFRAFALAASAALALTSGSGANAQLPAQAATTNASPPSSNGSALNAPPATGGGDAKSIGYLTATQLGAKCTDGSTAGISYCFAFITGVHDTMQAYERWLQQKEFCPDENAAQGELRKNFLAYLTAYPKSGQGQAASVVVVALKTSYPCKAG